MKKFESRRRYESKLAGFEGVAYTLNRMTEGRRIRLRLALAEPTAKLRDLMRERESLGEESGEPRVRELLDRMSSILEDEVNPKYLAWGLHSIEGLEIDGEPATPKSLIEAGPRELYDEILAAVRRETGLSEGEQKNSASPSTSGAPVDGRTSGTSASTASGTAGTPPATAESTSRST